MTSTANTEVLLRNDLDAYWMPFTANRAFKQSPRLLAYAEEMHYFSPEGRAMSLVRQRRTLPRFYRRGHKSASRRTTFSAAVSVRASESVCPGEPNRGAGARRFEPRVLYQFRVGSGRYRAKNRPRLSQSPWRRRPPEAGRARARLSWLGLRRHGGRRHRRKPQALRFPFRRRRSSSFDLRSRQTGLHEGRAGMGRASRRRTRKNRRSARCLDDCRGYRRAHGRLDRRSAAPRRLSGTAKIDLRQI